MCKNNIRCLLYNKGFLHAKVQRSKAGPMNSVFKWMTASTVAVAGAYVWTLDMLIDMGIEG
jgi:hypothetical protein